MLSLIALLLGSDSGISSAVINTLHFSEQRFSQKQESKADAVGLDLLDKTYGSTKGSVSFFKKIEKEDKISEFAYFFASHPSPRERIGALEELVGERYLSGYWAERCIERSRNVAVIKIVAALLSSTRYYLLITTRTRLVCSGCCTLSRKVPAAM